MDKEILKQFFGQSVRVIITAFFAMIVGKKYLPEEYAGIMLDSTVVLVTAALLQIGSLAWGWMKIRYNVIFARIARCVSPDTSMKEIAEKVKEQHTFVTKI